MALAYRIILTLTAVAAIAGGGYQAQEMHRRTAQIVHLAQESASWRKQVATLRAEWFEARTRPPQAPALSSPVASVPASGDAAFDAGLRLLLARVNRMKARLAEDPGQQIPEMGFLNDTAWFEAAEAHDLATEVDFRTALNELRAGAKRAFRDILTGALQAYLQNSEDQLPAAVEQLTPYFVTPVDETLLQRYEMRATGRAKDVPKGLPVIGEKAAAADSHGLANEFTASGEPVGLHLGGWSTTMASDEPESDEERQADAMALIKAIQAFQSAHRGDPPQDLQQLLPFFKNPADGAKYLEFKPEPMESH